MQVLDEMKVFDKMQDMQEKINDLEEQVERWKNRADWLEMLIECEHDFETYASKHAHLVEIMAQMRWRNANAV